MNNKKGVIFLILAALFWFTACKQDTPSVIESDYLKSIHVGSAIAAPMLVQTEKEAEIADTNNSFAIDSLDKEARGDESIEEKVVLEDAEVFNKGMDDARVIGHIGKGTNVEILGNVIDGKWYKLIFNGRVAYIESGKVGDVNAEDEHDTDAHRPNPSPEPNPTPTPDPDPTPTPDPGPTPTPDPGPTPTPDPGPTPTPEPSPEPTPEPSPEPSPEPTPEPSPEPSPEPTPEPSPEPSPEPTPEPSPEPTPEPTPDPISD